MNISQNELESLPEIQNDSLQNAIFNFDSNKIKNVGNFFKTLEKLSFLNDINISLKDN